MIDSKRRSSDGPGREERANSVECNVEDSRGPYNKHVIQMHTRSIIQSLSLLGLHPAP